MTVEERLAQLEAKVKAMENSAGKKKKTRDPDAPKRPKNGYMKFCDEHRETVRKDNPNESLGGVAKILGGMWNKLSAEEKEAYKNK